MCCLEVPQHKRFQNKYRLLLWLKVYFLGGRFRQLICSCKLSEMGGRIRGGEALGGCLQGGGGAKKRLGCRNSHRVSPWNLFIILFLRLFLRASKNTLQSKHSGTLARLFYIFEIFCSARLSRWTFRIFFIFFCSGEGKGEPPRCREGRGQNFIENPRRGGVQSGWGWEPRGREGVCRELGGGGLNIFFRGRKAHQVIFRKKQEPQKVLRLMSKEGCCQGDTERVVGRGSNSWRTSTLAQGS